MPCSHDSYLPLLNVFNFVQIAIQVIAVSDTDACEESEFVRILFVSLFERCTGMPQTA